MYPGASVEYILANHFGLNVEGAFRYHQGNYNDFQPYRPIFYDATVCIPAVWRVRLAAISWRALARESLLFYNQVSGCDIPTGGCTPPSTATISFFTLAWA